MKISKINNSYFNIKNIQKPALKQEIKLTAPMELLSYPSNYYLNFLGGKSLQLSQTMEQLYLYNTNIPPRVEQIALLELSTGNIDNKRLIDIHQQGYQELMDCESLDEAKQKFEEFQDVISSFDVKPRPNSFMEKWKKGEIKTPQGETIFDKDEDLTLQLLKMYWGRGLSTQDIDRATGLSAAAALHRLKIPHKDSLYGHYLKLSDEQANREIIEAIQANRTIPEHRAKREGKPLSEEHKRKISEALKLYYSEHEHIGFFREDEDGKYFEKFPYQSEIFSEVLTRAWTYKEANSIKKALSSYLKKTPEEAQKAVQDPKQAQNLKRFWKENEWARKNWSKCMSKSWIRQKELSSYGLIYEPLAKYDVPHDEIIKCLEVLGEDEITHDELKKIATIIIPDERDVKISGCETVPKEYREFLQKHEQELGKGTYIFSEYYSALQIYTTLLQNGMKRRIDQGRANDSLYLEAKSMLVDTGLDDNIEEIFDTQDLLRAYDLFSDIIKRCLKSKYPLFRTMFDDCIKEYYHLQKVQSKKQKKVFDDFLDREALMFAKTKSNDEKPPVNPSLNPLKPPFVFK